MVGKSEDEGWGKSEGGRASQEVGLMAGLIVAVRESEVFADLEPGSRGFSFFSIRRFMATTNVYGKGREAVEKLAAVTLQGPSPHHRFSEAIIRAMPT